MHDLASVADNGKDNCTHLARTTSRKAPKIKALRLVRIILVTLPTNGTESNISIMPVKRIRKMLFCLVLKMANLIRLRNA